MFWLTLHVTHLRSRSGTAAMATTTMPMRTKEDTIPPMNSCKQHRGARKCVCECVFVCMCITEKEDESRHHSADEQLQAAQGRDKCV